jgi:putative ABC transport system permease protein
VVGTNAFQVRRTPLRIGFFDDEEWRRVQRRPRITASDAEAVRAALPEAAAVALQSGWPTPQADIVWRDRTLGDVLIFGVTPAFQQVQDYRFASGRPLTDLDVRERRPVVVVGAEIADRLFENVDAVGHSVRILGQEFTVVGVVARKGRVLGQSFDGFVLLPISQFELIYGRRSTTTVSVKMRDADQVAQGMAQAEEAMRLAHRLRPTQENDFSIETADALVAIGIVVGGIVIMNIMLMAVTERTREIGLRKSVGATARDIRQQFLTEAVLLSALGGVIGVLWGWLFALAVSTLSPLPVRVTPWSVAVAVGLGAIVGVVFGVYPATRAARLDPIAAMRAE